MEVSQLSLISLLFFLALWGGLIGLLDNVNKALRIFLFENLELRKFKVKNAFFATFVFFQDFFFIIIAFIGIILLNFYFNNGLFRFLPLLSFGIGFVIYYFTLGKLLMLILRPIVLFTRRFVVGTLRSIYVFLIEFIIKKLVRTIKKSIAKKRNIKYNKKRRYQLIKLSECGFLEEIKQGKKGIYEAEFK